MTSPAKLLAAQQARCRKILERAIETKRTADMMVTALNESLARAERAIVRDDLAEIDLALDDLYDYGD